MPHIKKVISQIMNKANHISHVTISDTKNKLTSIDENVMGLNIKETLGMAKISDYVDILNNNGGLDLSSFQIQTCISSNFLIKLIFPILFKLGMLSTDNSLGEQILMFDDRKGYLTWNDIVCKLLPILVLEDGSTGGYSTITSIDDVCLVIDMKINGPLQQLLDSSYGKNIIQNVKLQNAKIKASDIGKMILLLEELSSSSTLSKVNLNHYNYQELLVINDYSGLKDLIIDYEEEKYQPIPIVPDSSCNGYIWCIVMQ